MCVYIYTFVRICVYIYIYIGQCHYWAPHQLSRICVDKWSIGRIYGNHSYIEQLDEDMWFNAFNESDSNFVCETI